MMYHKALILSGVSGTGNLALGYDQDTRSRLPDLVLAEEKPGKQKALARSVRFTDAQLEEWDRIKSDVVVKGNYCQFSQNPALRSRLLLTGDWSWWRRVRGTGSGGLVLRR